MTMRVQRVDGEYRVVLSAEVVEALHLTDGAEVEVRVRSAGAEGRGIRYISVDEALEAYRKTLPQHREAYRELAK
jgi:antitoxin component of MazEF toxin-antitoxin module